jgi:hypothetical protein
VTAEGLPAGATLYLARCVASLDDLKVLLVLMASRDRWFDPPAVGALCGLSVEHARRGLDRLVSANLVDIRATDAVRYQFCPVTPELEHGIDAVVDLYRREPRAVTEWIAGRSRRMAASRTGRGDA